jgi:hypothetical protein
MSFYQPVKTRNRRTIASRNPFACQDWKARIMIYSMQKKNSQQGNIKSHDRYRVLGLGRKLVTSTKYLILFEHREKSL